MHLVRPGHRLVIHSRIGGEAEDLDIHVCHGVVRDNNTVCGVALFREAGLCSNLGKSKVISSYGSRNNNPNQLKLFATPVPKSVPASARINRLG